MVVPTLVKIAASSNACPATGSSNWYFEKGYNKISVAKRRAFSMERLGNTSKFSDLSWKRPVCGS